MQEEKKEKGIDELYEDAKNYVENRAEYLRLYIVKKASQVFADIITNSIVVICFVLAFLFGTVTLALFLSDVFGSYVAGFGGVALIYLALALIVYFTKDKFIEKAIVNFTIKNYFNKLADKEEDDEKV